jgi:putative spermidine/putrescine transport system ATP-binding protein
VSQALARVKLSTYADRLPKQLSGGQQQRVALARALVIEPDVLLLDEPLSNLDATLRQEMKIEIRQLQQALGLTTIFVTHDQDEAMSVADRMVLMRQGRIEQMGTPGDIFETPRSRFAAEFMGVTNLLAGKTVAPGLFVLDDGTVVRLADSSVVVGPCSLALRPERIEVSAAPPVEGDNVFHGTVEVATYRGALIEYRLRSQGGLAIIARRPTPALGGPAVLSPGVNIHVSWPVTAGSLVPEN